MDSGHREPLNPGSEEMVSINQLARLILRIAGKDGVTLRHGLEPTCRWIEKQVAGR